MTVPALLALATAVPPTRYPQAEVLDYLLPAFEANRRANGRFARSIFLHSAVETRHMVATRQFFAQPRSTLERNTEYWRHALPLAELAACAALEQAGLRPGDLDDLIAVSCTGYDIPGLDLQLAGRLSMRPNLQRTCVLGMGCYAAFPALQRARQAVLAQPDRTVLVLCLELCSLHLQLDDSTENMVVSALFADGAAAAVVGAEERRASAGALAAWPRLVDAATYSDYQTFDHMAFQVTDEGFRMRLSAYVPDVLAANVEAFADGLLARNHLTRRDVRFWGIHPGGSKILDYLEQQLSLPGDALDHSRRVLRDYGNMSSPTVLFVLDDIQRHGHPQPGDYGLLMAFGPGLTMEAGLVQW